jgi:hypothetical protein
MARYFVNREITITKVTAARMTMVDGAVNTEQLEDVILVGNVSLEKANKEVKKIYGEGTTAFTVQPNTHKYRIATDVFVKHAEIVTEDQE